jgi:hypothetical protein
MAVDKRKKWLIAGMAAVGVLTGILWLQNRLAEEEPIRVLERNAPGAGDTPQHMEVWTDAGSFPLDFTLKERTYQEEELEQIFEQGRIWLDSVWLGDNTEAQAVTKNLYFPGTVDSLGLSIRWETESYRWIRTDGTVTEEALAEAPLTTKVRAVLKYGDAEKNVDYELTILPPEQSAQEAFKNKVEEALEGLQLSGKNESQLELPESIDGISLTWYDRKTPIWPKIFLFGNLCVILLYFSWEERRFREAKNREEILCMDYPEIVYRLVLLISSGMTVRGAWEKMISDYQRWRSQTGKSRWGYEEMEMTLREMNYGIPELKAYENFGKRCGSQGYIRLSSLLIQQVKRGAKGMNQLLSQEVAEAEIFRRENARKRAEEAGTRLILPMVLMMMVVFAVLMIPAFLSMNL